MKAITRKQGLNDREVNIRIKGIQSAELIAGFREVDRTHGIASRELLSAPEDKYLDVDCWLPCCGGLKTGTDNI
jgi:hypothetical protein